MLLALPLAAYLALESDFGKAKLTAYLESRLSDEAGLKLAVSPITGSLFGQFKIAKLELADSEGTWLSLSDLAVDWSPKALITERKILLHSLSAAEVTLQRAPDLAAADQDEGPFEIPRLPVALSTEAIELTRINLGAPLLGTAVALTLEGAARVPEKGDFTANLEIRRLDGVEGELQASAALTPEDQSLELSLTLSEAAGGIIAHLAGVPDLPALRLELEGAGTLARWEGQLTGAVENQASLESDVTLKGVEGLELSAKGQALLADLLEAELRPLVRPQVDFGLTARIDPAWSHLALTDVALESDSLALEGTAQVALEGLEITGRLEGESRDPVVLNRLTAPLGFSTVTARGAFEVTETQVVADITARLSDLSAEGVTASQADLSAQVLGDPSVAAAPLDLDAQLDLQGFASSVEELDLLLGGTPGLSLQGRYRPTEAQLDIAAAEVSAASFSARLAGDLLIETLGGSLSGSLEVPQLDAVAAVISQSLTGSGSFTLEAQSEDFTEGLSLTLEGGLSGFRSGYAEADALLGESPRIKADLTQAPRSLKLSRATLQGQAIDLSATGRLDDDFSMLALDYDVALPDLSPLSQSLAMPLEGALTAAGRLEGPVENPGLSGSAALRQAKVDAIALQTLDLDYDLKDLAKRPQGEVSAKGQSSYGAIDTSSGFVLDEDRLTLTDLRAEARQAEISASGPVTVFLESGLIDGTLSGEAKDLGAFADLIETRLAGQLSFTAALRPDEGKQGATIDAVGQGIRFDEFEAAELQAALEARDLLGDFGGNADLTASGLTAGGVTVNSLHASAKGGLQTLDLSLEAAGTLYKPFELSATGELRHSPESTQVRVSRLSGTVLEQALALQQDLVVTQSAQRLSVEGLDVTFGPGALSGALVLDPENVQLDADFRSLPLALAAALDVNLDIEGSLNGTASLSGPAAQPQGRVDLRIDNFTLDDGSETKLPKLTAVANARLSASDLTIDGQVTGFADRELKVKAAFPARLSLVPLDFTVAPSAPLQGSLQFEGSAQSIAQFVLSTQERLRGDAYADLTLGGTLSDPLLTGGLGVKNAVYENLITGTTLKDLEMDLAADGSDLAVKTMTARTSKGGRVSGGGKIAFDPDAERAIDLEISLSKAMLLQRDDIMAALNGKLQLQGSFTAMRLEGKLETTSVELRLIDDLPPEVITIDVIEKNKPESDQPQKQRSGSSPVTIALDITLTLPGRVFLRSQEVDTEWSGRFDITGTTDKPIVEGTLNPVRGTVSLLGKRFNLQQGSITLDGSAELDPLLNLNAVHQATDLTAIVQVQGRLSDPEITLTSTPPLPEDEVISRVLFNKSANNLTTAEAVELATVVANLARGSSGGGVIGGVRSALGLDVLSVGASESGGGPSVSAGKYLVDGVYLGVDQSTETDSTRAKVEVELTPTIRLESEAGADNSGSVGLKWQWDY